MSYQGFPGTLLCWQLQKRILKFNGTENDKGLEFKLLYKATKNKCGVEPFNKYCLDKGPTLTVLYGRTGTIFGGYTSKSWTADGRKNYVEDPSAFLFSCNNTENLIIYEIEEKHSGWAICCRKDWGPSFGGGYLKAFDLQVFRGNVEIKKNDEGYFPLNGSINFNCTYKNVGQRISNENLYVSDVEVYAVNEARNLINSAYKRLSSINKDLNVLCIGRAGAGKSWFIDNVLSTLQEQKVYQASGGLKREGVMAVGQSGTRKLHRHTLKILEEENKMLETNVHFLDMPGYDAENKVDAEKIIKVIEGHCPEGYDLFNQKLDTDDEAYIQKPTLCNMVHFICFIIDNKSLQNPEVEQKMQNRILLDIIVPKRIPYVVVLTKPDKMKDFSVDVTIEKVSLTFGIRPELIHVVPCLKDGVRSEKLVNNRVLRLLAEIMTAGILYYEDNYRKKDHTSQL